MASASGGCTDRTPMEQTDHVIRAHPALRVTGSIHEKMGAACEDVALIRETPDLRFFGLADGQGGQSHCVFGGQETLRQTAAMLRAVPPGLLAKYRYTDALRFALIRRFRERIALYARLYGVPESRFASTLVSFAVDPQTGDYVIVHLGDGCILGILQSGEIRMLSTPDNGLTRQETWLTTSEQALAHLRLKYGNVRGYRRILLLSDGAECLCKGRNISPWARHNLPGLEPKRILEHMRRSVPADDASCVVIDICPKSPFTAEKQSVIIT